MILTSFEAVNYRNIPSVSLRFEPGVNLLYGQNAQGKTNVLEGIYTFARGKSFRGATDEEQVRFGEKGFSVAIGFHADGRDQSLSYRYYEGSRQRRKNGAPVRSRSEMIGHFRAVLFYPEHLQLVKGGPGERRLFLNIAISQLDPTYIHLLNRYQTILENRNSILKTAQKTGYLDRTQLDAWNESMADACAAVVIQRRDYIARLEKWAVPIMRDLSGGRENLSLSYACDAGDLLTAAHDGEKEKLSAFYRDLLSSSLQREAAAGCTLFGVHRDDLAIGINGTDARAFASQGQQRSAVLSLKLGEGEVAREEGGEYPVFLFDDVLSELDETRRAYVLSGVGEKQLIMTACDSGALSGHAANVISVEGGHYESAHRER